MQRTVFTDPFFTKQPPLQFIEELKQPLHDRKPENFGKRPREAGEIDVSGLFLEVPFPEDPEGLLETSYADFARFLSVYELSGNGQPFPVRLRKGATACFEAYEITVCAREITITAADTEGIRRGLIYLEDMLRRSEGPFLHPDTITRKPHLRSRITRCFFSPINRPPKFGDELSDDVDYYPEEYLNRLMHDGANGVWIYTRFSDILPSSIITEYGQGWEKRIEKLNRTIEKCRRYGIGVYIFAIEPVALTPELAKKYPDMAGAPGFNGHPTFCCSSPRGQAYCYEAGRRLLELAPRLRGFISITYGERPTSCSSNIVGAEINDGVPVDCGCPRCRDKSSGQLLALALEALRSGARTVNPSFETISWTYGHRRWDEADIREYVRCAPEDVILMQNFDDMGWEEQLGRPRLCTDYWLSYVGPSQLFRATAEEARQLGKTMFAKMQVCCSHEIATVPYVPVPGLLMEKYAAAMQQGVTGIMQCWYFGNYPSMMSKAAGELAFAEDFSQPDALLEDIAGIYYGRSGAKAAAAAWKLFGDGYRKYPANIMFSYYGPMHDGVVWDLALLPRNFSPSRSWQLVDPPDGDRINDTLLTGHTLEEALTLCRQMQQHWQQGMQILSGIPCQTSETAQMHAVAQAIGILFNSGTNILEFYHLRDLLGRGIGDARETLSRMRALVLLEQENSRKMIPLCNACGSLGYHSECEGYKFFPEKLEDRVERLQKLLETEFPQVEARLQAGLTPLAYYAGEEDHPSLKRYFMPLGALENAPWETFGADNAHRFRMSYDQSQLHLELQSSRQVTFLLCPEYQLLRSDVCVRFDQTGLMPFVSEDALYGQILGARAQEEKAKYQNIRFIDDGGTHLVITLDLRQIGADPIRPMKLKLVADGESWCQEPPRPLRPDTMPLGSLGKRHVIPEDYGWIIPWRTYAPDRNNQ